MLADAGVELGANYPYPIISLAESEAHLKQAAAVIQQTAISNAPKVGKVEAQP